MKFCTNCGIQLEDNVAFCTECGTQANSNDAPEQTIKEVPTFTPPQEEIPTFSPPPAPTFTPPKQERRNGTVCHFHPMESSVTRCECCGKYICQDCAEAYGVSSGEYAGQALCYDCTAKMVEDNVRDLTKNKNKIKIQFILSIVGMVLGFIVGLYDGLKSGDVGAAFIGGLIYAGLGGVFLTALKVYLNFTWQLIKTAFSDKSNLGTVLGLCLGLGVAIFKCIMLTISNTYHYIKYLKETSGFIESDSNALQQMKDYMEYTQVMSQNKGVDLETLMNEGSQLYNNSYAQSVATNGEVAADAQLRRCVTTIAENGEIIRSFAA